MRQSSDEIVVSSKVTFDPAEGICSKTVPAFAPGSVMFVAETTWNPSAKNACEACAPVSPLTFGTVISDCMDGLATPISTVATELVCAVPPLALNNAVRPSPRTAAVTAAIVIREIRTVGQFSGIDRPTRQPLSGWLGAQRNSNDELRAIRPRVRSRTNPGSVKGRRGHSKIKRPG